MGEAPAFFPDDLQRDFDGVCDFRSRGNQTATIVGNKTYVIGETDDDPKSTVGVRVFNKCTREWSIPTVLGTRPELFKDLSALLVNEDRILVVQGNSRCEDCIWFLEVDTSYVREQKKTFETEVVAWSKGIVGNVGKPIVVSGPSGVGKGTLIAKLMKDFPSMFGFSVSHTTRAPRDKETNGFHYHFTERSVMEKEIKDGKFLEFASVHGNLYGTSIEAVEVVADAGKRCILDIDVQGAKSVRASPLEAVFIFICPPSLEELEKRLRARGTETEEQIQRRLCNAKAELEQGKATGLFDHILVNDDLDACYESLKKILGLHEGAVTADLSSPKLNLPTIYSLAKVNHKILVNYGLAPTEKLSKDLFVMDLSSLKGGAPGQTRGINIYSVDNFENGMNGFEGLS